MSISSEVQQVSSSQVDCSPGKQEPVNSPLTAQDKGLIIKFSTDIKKIFNLKGQGAIRLLFNIYGKCYYVNDGCYAHRITLAAETRQSERAVYKQLARLKKAGCIEIVPKDNYSSQVKGQSKIVLSQDFRYALGILKKSWLKFNLRHTSEARLVNNSIIEILKRLAYNKTETKTKNKFVVVPFRSKSEFIENSFRSEALKILAKLTQIKEIHRQGGCLTYNLNKTYTNAKQFSNSKPKETEQQNRLRIAKAKKRVEAMLKTEPKDKKIKIERPQNSGVLVDIPDFDLIDFDIPVIDFDIPIFDLDIQEIDWLKQAKTG